jgi:hypothetical protein
MPPAKKSKTDKTSGGTSQSDAERFIEGISNKSLRGIAAILHQYLLSIATTDYVKTVYIGYDFNGEMLAALYRNTTAIEVALPLPEFSRGPLLMDASHLTWRTLPVMIHVTKTDQLAAAKNLIDEAFLRLESGIHEVDRTPEFFKARKKGRPERKV